MSVPTSESVTLDDLSERQAAFVREYVERGGRPGSAASAAQAVGYAKPGPAGRAAARVRASELLRNPKVLSALRDELTRKLNAGAVIGVQMLIDLCQNARSEQVRLGAARELVDRGYGPVISKNASVQVSTSVEDLFARLDAREAAERASAAVVDGNVIE
jgi:hypothetical protein